MAYTNPRGQALTAIGATVSTLMACTLADYAVAGTVPPAVGDLVTFSTTGSWYAKIAPDNTTKRLGIVQKVELAPVGTAVGYLTVEWMDVIRFVECPVANLANVTLGDSLIKNGDTSVSSDFDATATAGNIIAVAKSAATGAGTAVGAVVVL